MCLLYRLTVLIYVYDGIYLVCRVEGLRPDVFSRFLISHKEQSVSKNGDQAQSSPMRDMLLLLFQDELLELETGLDVP